MKKLTLRLDELAVESFTTSAATAPRGTVDAHGTQFGPTCGPENTCGPLTCGPLFCEKDTVDPLLCGSGGCGTGGTGGTGGSGVLSCAGCTTFDYTQFGGDTCDWCMSRESDSPARCRCI